MIDLKAFRQDPQGFIARLKRKGADDLGVQLLKADSSWKTATQSVEAIRAEQKVLGKPTTDEEVARARRLKDQLRFNDEQLKEAEARRHDLLIRIPNPPADDVPDGFTEDDAEVVREVGEPPTYDFEVRDHLDLAQPHGWINAEAAARISGTRFVYRVGDLALLELALYRFALDRLVEKGFVPMLPPVLVREEAMYGTGFFPTDEMNIYAVERDGLYLTGTSEVALASFHMGEKLEEDELPLRYAAFSTNFRREAGAAGKDTRGMFRVHQFDKVEMFAFTFPEESSEEHERLLAIEEELVGDLDLPYRVVNVAAGDLGASAAKKYDIEAWFPGQQRYREITSTSNTTDYQARRLDIRFRRERKLEFVHTLNGTAVTARAGIALMENFQNEDGSISVPESLWDFGAPQRMGAEKARV